MLKQAWRSYLASLHPRNYKKIKYLGIEFFWLYYFIINPIVGDHELVEDWAFKVLFWITILTPYYLMWWSNLGHKLSMPKMMYLLPMKTEGRREYLNTLLVIKIGFPTLVHFILQLIQGAIYGTDWLEILLSTLAVASFGIGMYVCSELRSKFDRYIRYGVRGKDGTGKDAWLNWFCMIYAVIYRLVAMMIESDGEPIGVLGWIWIIGFLSILLIFDIAIIKTRYRATIEDVCNYEEAFNVLGKVKNV